MNNQYLNEENYQRGKKKVIGLALIVFLLGLVIGGGLIVTGIMKTNSTKSEITEKESKRTESDIQADITDVESKIDAAKLEMNTMRNELQRIFMEDRGFSDRYYEKDSEITAKENELSKLQSTKSDLESELWKIQSGYNNTKNSIATSRYIPFYMFGAFIIVASSMIAGSIYIFGKRREIAAFTTQQVMPIAKEGINEMAPTIGNVAGEIAKGIKEGMKDDDKGIK
jgi:hypothetical protein